jgi:ribosomal protein L11 methylase PrmA
MYSTSRHPSSYRDPSGYVFYHNNILYRQVNLCFKDDYDLFIGSGLYQHLVDSSLMIQHTEDVANYTGDADRYKTLRPQPLSLLSYPYEWCFDMLKDAALLTLKLATEAMKFGMMLKDASAYNVQWHNGKMIFIDTLSFEKYNAAKPWIAYRQFCEQFLAPLALMHYRQLPLQRLLLSYPEGIPLLIAKKLLPWTSKLSLNSYLHLHLHASIITRSSQPQPILNNNQSHKAFSSTKLTNLLRSLEELIHSFKMSDKSGVWSGYYDEALQRGEYVEQKEKIVEALISGLPLKTAIDVGANEGTFSKLMVGKNITTISADLDHYSVNRLYISTKETSGSKILPLLIDFSNPSPAVGVNNEERASLLSRTNRDLVLALAVIHHLAIGKNITFHQIADLFAALGSYLIIEFVPKEDEKVQLMLAQKKDIYDWYNEAAFVAAFEERFTIEQKRLIPSSGRTVYLMSKHEH